MAMDKQQLDDRMSIQPILLERSTFAKRTYLHSLIDIATKLRPNSIL